MNRKYRRTIIAGNWKMNLLAQDVKPYAEKIKASFGREKICDAVLCVPAVLVPAAVRAFRDTRIGIGAQDISEFSSGAYTGEISAVQLKSVGAKYVIIGHSERREYHGETDEATNRKLKAALGAGLCPIVCVGESLSERERGVSLDKIRSQVKSAFYEIPAQKARKAVIAYEPIWAIGTGLTASPEQAQEICAEIRRTLRTLYDARCARAVSILYGGSMKPENAFGLLAQPDIDGGLIGGASLDAEQFLTIINAANQ